MSLYYWFIHFGEDEIKSVLFFKEKGLKEINISLVDHLIEKHNTIEFLGCELDSKISGEVMVSKAWKKLMPVRRQSCNGIAQTDFDYGCFSWFPFVKKNLKIKLQKAQNKYICSYLNLPLRFCINPLDFRKINLLPANGRIKSCISNTIFKYWNGICTTICS